MTTTPHHNNGRPRPVPVPDDPEWVAELLDTYFDGDLDVTIAIVEGLLRRLRNASKSRRTLRRVPEATLNEVCQRKCTSSRV